MCRTGQSMRRRWEVSSVAYRDGALWAITTLENVFDMLLNMLHWRCERDGTFSFCSPRDEGLSCPAAIYRIHRLHSPRRTLPAFRRVPL